MEQLKSSRFPRNTMDKSTWAVMLFSDCRMQHNSHCLQHTNTGLVYIIKPFSQMNDDELNYSTPLFFSEVLKSDGTEYTPDTLRHLVSQVTYINVHIHYDISAARDMLFCYMTLRLLLQMFIAMFDVLYGLDS